MTCTNCGALLPEGTKFCSSCGHPQAHREQPFYGAPAEPIYEQPAFESPSEPAFEQPVYEAPAEPVYEHPVFETPFEPAFEQPVYEAPAEPIYEQPVFETPSEPALEQPAYEAPAEPTYEQPHPNAGDYTAYSSAAAYGQSGYNNYSQPQNAGFGAPGGNYGQPGYNQAPNYNYANRQYTPAQPGYANQPNPYNRPGVYVSPGAPLKKHFTFGNVLGMLGVIACVVGAFLNLFSFGYGNYSTDSGSLFELLIEYRYYFGRNLPALLLALAIAIAAVTIILFVLFACKVNGVAVFLSLIMFIYAAVLLVAPMSMVSRDTFTLPGIGTWVTIGGATACLVGSIIACATAKR